jgi:MFS family permease
LVVLCLAGACWAFSFGAGAPLASVWLERAGYTNTIVGLNTAVYYLGIALTAGAVPWMMRRWGRGCLAVGMVVSGLTVMAFPWGQGLPGWFLLRALNGVAGAMSLIPLETLVNKTSPPAQRARNFGFYAFAVALGWALGNLELGMQAPRAAFCIGGAVTLFCGTGVLPWLAWPGDMEEERHGRTPLGFGRNFLSFGSAWVQGFMEGGMVALLPVYLLAIGYSDKHVGWLMGGLMVGVILFQVPVAWLADRLGRTVVLLGCYAAVIAGLGWLPSCHGSVDLPAALFLVGACSGAFYPLGLAVLGERLPNSGLARASAWYLAINCLGSVAGPVAAGRAMDCFGSRGMFFTGEVAVLFVLAIWIGLRLHARRRAARAAAESPSQSETATHEAA